MNATTLQRRFQTLFGTKGTVGRWRLTTDRNTSDVYMFFDSPGLLKALDRDDWKDAVSPLARFYNGAVAGADALPRLACGSLELLRAALAVLKALETVPGANPGGVLADLEDAIADCLKGRTP